jgi:hypothetical protein
MSIKQERFADFDPENPQHRRAAFYELQTRELPQGRAVTVLVPYAAPDLRPEALADVPPEQLPLPLREPHRFAVGLEM